MESEHVASGTAQTATATGELPGDGTWELEPGPSAEYRTRVVVRRAERAEDFSGVVLLEWLDVSGGVDADPEWTTLREEVGRQGHVCIGVSAQALGIEGGDVRVRVSDVEGSDAAGKGLRAIDPERYGDLEHPGDAYAYDIFSQVGRAVRAGIPALDDLDPEHLVAAGESQSAMALVTYVNGFHPMPRSSTPSTCTAAAPAVCPSRRRARTPTSQARSAASPPCCAPTTTRRSSSSRPRTT